MPVYVDPLMKCENSKAPRCFRGKKACHMYADTVDELHTFADRVGLMRAWFQNHRLLPHYDLTAAWRAKAVRLGAIEVSFRDVAAMIHREDAEE